MKLNEMVATSKRIVRWGSSLIDPRIQLIEEPRQQRKHRYKYRCSQLTLILQKFFPGKFSRVDGSIIDVFFKKKQQNCAYFLNVGAPQKQILDEYCKENEIMTVYERIPERIKFLLREGECTLVLEVANEGYAFSAAYGAAIHQLIDKIGCQSRQVVYATQNHSYEEKYNDWCDRNDISKEHRIKFIVTHVSLLLMVIRYSLAKKQIWNISESKILAEKRPKKWLCLNNIPRAHRCFLLYNLIEKDLLREGNFSFNHKLSSNIFTPDFVDELKVFFPFQNGESISEIISQLDRKLPIYLDLPDRSLLNAKGRGDVFQIEKGLYKDSYFSIIAESDFPEGRDPLRFTEKTLKPLLGLHPFLVFGSPGTLKLQNLGFRTFDGFFNESYDDIDDPNQRFNLLFKQIEFLSSLQTEKLHELYSESFDILVHNYNHFFQNMPDWCRKHILTDFLPIFLER
jgi:hypothetical protein